MTDIINQLGVGLGQIIGLPPKIVDGAMVVVAADDSRWVIESPKNAVSVFIHSALFPVHDDSQMLYRLLELNFQSDVLRSAWLSINPKKGDLTLCASFPVETIDAPLFYNVLSNLFDVKQNVLAMLNVKGSDFNSAVPNSTHSSVFPIDMNALV